MGLRLQFPRWGRDKLAVLLRRQQLPVSTSMVGRILRQLKRQGRLVEPPRTGVPGSRRALRAASPCGAQTQAVRSVCARRLGRGRYRGRASGAGRSLQTVHRPRRDLALGCDPSPRARHRPDRNSVPHDFATPYAVSDSRCPGRWWSESAAEFEQACPATRPPPVRAPAPLAQTQRRRRTRQPHPYRGVLIRSRPARCR